MIALHQTGRSVEAMVTYSEWKQTLSDSWGIDPGGAIQQLSRDICVRASSHGTGSAAHEQSEMEGP